MESRWFDLLREYYGVNLSSDRVVLWLRLLREDDACGGRTTDDELCAVMRWVRKQREGDVGRRAPTLETVIGWVRWYRKEQSIGRRGFRADDGSPEGILARIKNEMRRASTHSARWDIMCTGLDGNGCLLADRWAEQQWPDWVQSREAIRSQQRRTMRACIEGIGA